MDKLRVLLDTNIFGFLLLEENREITGKLQQQENIIVYGCKTVRNELRETSRSKMIENRQVRILALELYDSLVGKHSLEMTDLIGFLASEYKKEYKGHISHRKLCNDFLIVATAALNKLDIICSDDNSTMKSTKAKEAYEKVNEKNNLRTPSFIGLKEIGEMIK